MTHQYMELKIKELEKRIKALEQQSCDNAINRKDTLKAMIGQLAAEATLYKVVKNMPPVTPQPKVDLDKIREDITAISISGIVDEHTMFIRTGEQVKQMALDIIDKYKAEFEVKDKVSQG